MQAFRANNVESAKSRLSLCAQDIREQLEIAGNTSELCSQLGAVLGMLGDCWYVFCPLWISMTVSVHFCPIDISQVTVTVTFSTTCFVMSLTA